jgi:hypothetical protein
LGVRELQKSGRAVNTEALGCLESLDEVCVGDAFVFEIEKNVELVCENCGIFDCAVSAMAADRVELREYQFGGSSSNPLDLLYGQHLQWS